MGWILANVGAMPSPATLEYLEWMQDVEAAVKVKCPLERSTTVHVTVAGAYSAAGGTIGNPCTIRYSNDLATLRAAKIGSGNVRFRFAHGAVCRPNPTAPANSLGVFLNQNDCSVDGFDDPATNERLKSQPFVLTAFLVDTAISGATWTQVPGKTNVYYANLPTSPEKIYCGWVANVRTSTTRDFLRHPFRFYDDSAGSANPGAGAGGYFTTLETVGSETGRLATHLTTMDGLARDSFTAVHETSGGCRVYVRLAGGGSPSGKVELCCGTNADASGNIGGMIGDVDGCRLGPGMRYEGWGMFYRTASATVSLGTQSPAARTACSAGKISVIQGEGYLDDTHNSEHYGAAAGGSCVWIDWKCGWGRGGKASGANVALLVGYSPATSGSGGANECVYLRCGLMFGALWQQGFTVDGASPLCQGFLSHTQNALQPPALVVCHGCWVAPEIQTSVPIQMFSTDIAAPSDFEDLSTYKAAMVLCRHYPGKMKYSLDDTATGQASGVPSLSILVVCKSTYQYVGYSNVLTATISQNYSNHVPPIIDCHIIVDFEAFTQQYPTFVQSSTSTDYKIPINQSVFVFRTKDQSQCVEFASRTENDENATAAGSANISRPQIWNTVFSVVGPSRGGLVTAAIPDHIMGISNNANSGGLVLIGQWIRTNSGTPSSMFPGVHNTVSPLYVQGNGDLGGNGYTPESDSEMALELPAEAAWLASEYDINGVPRVAGVLAPRGAYITNVGDMIANISEARWSQVVTALKSYAASQGSVVIVPVA